MIHADISTEAFWRSACGARPAKDGTNLSTSDAQVTCRKCLAAMGFATSLLPNPARPVGRIK
jgi:hypothetical protein